MNKVFAQALEDVEAQAYADFWRAASAQEGYSATQVHQVAGATVGVMPGIVDPYPMWELIFNSVIGLGIAQPATLADVDRIIEHYRRASVHFSVRLSTQAQPAEVREWLEHRGLRVALNLYKCVRNTEPPPQMPTDLRIEEIDERQSSVYAALAAPIEFLRSPVGALVGRRGWRHYLAFDGEQAVACGSLFVSDSWGWLGFAFTRDSHRHRGAQSALIARRIMDAAAMNCRYVTAETAAEAAGEHNSSYHNMLRAGFALADERPVYVL